MWVFFENMILEVIFPNLSDTFINRTLIKSIGANVGSLVENLRIPVCLHFKEREICRTFGKASPSFAKFCTNTKLENWQTGNFVYHPCKLVSIPICKVTKSKSKKLTTTRLWVWYLIPYPLPLPLDMF